MNDSGIIEKLEEYVKEGFRLSEKLSLNRGSRDKDIYKDCSRWKTRCSSLLEIRFKKTSHYFKNFSEYMDFFDKALSTRGNIGKATGVLEASLHDLESGLTEDLFYKTEVALLGDLLDQAYEFLDNNFRLASAIYGRVSLEKTIKKFAEKNEIKEKSFDKNIIELRKKELIHKPLENSLRANYEIGSWATHGNEKFEDVSHKEIKEYLNFIRDKVLILE